uniref:Uncharacterized protein n=1 Tax=Steinernema glaseri TaxID=37863 RepID=A0A1I7XWQ6_9BILA
MQTRLRRLGVPSRNEKQSDAAGGLRIREISAAPTDGDASERTKLIPRCYVFESVATDAATSSLHLPNPGDAPVGKDHDQQLSANEWCFKKHGRLGDARLKTPEDKGVRMNKRWNGGREMMWYMGLTRMVEQAMKGCIEHDEARSVRDLMQRARGAVESLGVALLYCNRGFSGGLGKAVAVGGALGRWCNKEFCTGGGINCDPDWTRKSRKLSQKVEPRAGGRFGTESESLGINLLVLATFLETKRLVFHILLNSKTEITAESRWNVSCNFSFSHISRSVKILDGNKLPLDSNISWMVAQKPDRQNAAGSYARRG